MKIARRRRNRNAEEVVLAARYGRALVEIVSATGGIDQDHLRRLYALAASINGQWSIRERMERP